MPWHDAEVARRVEQCVRNPTTRQQDVPHALHPRCQGGLELLDPAGAWVVLGPVARQTQLTDFGGYLDIVCDFIFYSFIPFSFAIAHPEFALAACFLMLSFMGTGTSFLAYAILQAKHPETSILPSGQRKSFYYLGGLTEGTETIFVLGLCFWLPDYFAWLAWGFGILCWITVITRIQAAWLDFGKDC